MGHRELQWNEVFSQALKAESNSISQEGLASWRCGLMIALASLGSFLCSYNRSRNTRPILQCELLTFPHQKKLWLTI